MVCCGDFLSGLVYIMFCVLLIFIWCVFSCLCTFSSMSLFNTCFMSLTWDLSPSIMPIIQKLFSVLLIFSRLLLIWFRSSILSSRPDTLSSTWFLLFARLSFEFSSWATEFSVPSSFLLEFSSVFLFLYLVLLSSPDCPLHFHQSFMVVLLGCHLSSSPWFHWTVSLCFL